MFLPKDRILQAVNAALESSEFISLSIMDDKKLILKTDDASRERGGNPYTIALKSPVTGWQYELTLSRSALIQEIAIMRNILFLAAAGILLICFIFSAFFSAWFYKPIKETLGLLSINTIYSGNELRQIKSSIALLKQQRDDLQDKMNEHSPLLVSYYYMALLLGPEQEREQAAAELQKILPLSFPWYRVCILIQRTPRGIALATMPALMVQADLDKLDSPVTIQAINQSGRTLLILQYSSEDDFKHWMDNVLALYPDVILAAGCPANSIIGLAESYTDANRICDFRLTQSGYRALGVHTEAQGYYFPFETEADLMLALWTGNQTRAGGLIKEILGNNANSNGSLDEAYRGLEHILRRVSNEIEASPAAGELSEEWIFRQAANICSAQAHDAGKHHLDPKLLLEVVESSIQNPNLSLQYVADRFDVSVSLISKAFKEIEGTGFNEYINRRRMEMATDLISEGYEVLAAAKMVGYGNDTTFRRLFKAHTGLAPSEYRQKKQTP
jgi:AraC-like DNA-binding protein